MASAKNPARIAYIQKLSGNPLTSLELAQVLKLKATKDVLDSNSDPIADADTLAKRIENSDAVLAYLTPEGVTAKEFIVNKNTENATLVGAGFFDTNSRFIHDLSFDYEAIDQLDGFLDRRADEIVLDIILSNQENGSVLSFAHKSDTRLSELFTEVGLKVRGEVEDIVIFENDQLSEKSFTVYNSQKLKDTTNESNPTDESIIEEFREICSEAADFEVDERVAQAIFERGYALIGEGKEYGTRDTVVRERAITEFAKALTGCNWPNNGEASEDPAAFDRFCEELKFAHDSKLQTLKTESA